MLKMDRFNKTQSVMMNASLMTKEFKSFLHNEQTNFFTTFSILIYFIIYLYLYLYICVCMCVHVYASSRIDS